MNTPTVLITGALTGIGRATALAFAHEGANVVVSGRREEAGQQLVAELRAVGVKAAPATSSAQRSSTGPTPARRTSHVSPGSPSTRTAFGVPPGGVNSRSASERGHR